METAYEPLGSDDTERIARTADQILNSLRERDPRYGFNERAIAFLARAIEGERGRRDQARLTRLAPLYGAFLGHALIASFPVCAGRWVRIAGDIAIVFRIGAREHVVRPIESVLQQFEHGAPRSIQIQFTELRRLAGEAPRKGSDRRRARLTLSNERLRELHPELYSGPLWAARLQDALGLDSAMSDDDWRRRLGDHLQRGDPRAAIVVSPEMIAAYSAEIDGVVLLSFDRALLEARGWRPGTRLLAVNRHMRGTEPASDLLFGPNASGRCGNVHPLIANLLSEDLRRIEQLSTSIDAREWMRAAECVRGALTAGITPRDGRPLLAMQPVVATV